MKKTCIRVLALCLALVMLSMAMIACGSKLNGVYQNNTFGLIITYTFSGNEFTRTMSGLTEFDTGVTISGTYSISDGSIILTSASGYVETLTFSQSGENIYIAEMEFVQQ